MWGSNFGIWGHDVEDTKIWGTHHFLQGMCTLPFPVDVPACEYFHCEKSN